MTGSLYIVATPVGNLEDITHRALRVLREVDLIAAEDTRHTRKLLTHFGITTDLVSYYREKESQRSGELVDRLLSGADVALVSDAGTPAISDPGSVLVREARKQGVRIIPIPGPSALAAAVSCAGLTPGSFLFIGFPPAKGGQRRQLLIGLRTSEYPLVFYKSPHRIKKFIDDAHEILGDRKILWAREITKKFEDITETSLAELAATLHDKKIRGEIVVIIHPGTREVATGETIDEILDWYYKNSDLSIKEISKQISTDMGVSRSEVYRKALGVWGKK